MSCWCRFIVWYMDGYGTIIKRVTRKEAIPICCSLRMVS